MKLKSNLSREEKMVLDKYRTNGPKCLTNSERDILRGCAVKEGHNTRWTSKEIAIVKYCYAKGMPEMSEKLGVDRSKTAIGVKYNSLDDYSFSAEEIKYLASIGLK